MRKAIIDKLRASDGGYGDPDHVEATVKEILSGRYDKDIAKWEGDNEEVWYAAAILAQRTHVERVKAKRVF